MNKLFAFLRKEITELIPPTLFFLFVFQIVIFARRLIDDGAEGAYLTTSATALVGSVIVGKSVLIADALPATQWFRSRRLIYNVVWRTALYLSLALAFQLLEELIPLISRYHGLGPGLANLLQGIHWPRFWATHVILAVFLSFYTLVSAMIRVIGPDRFRQVFFGWHGSRDAGSVAVREGNAGSP